MVKIWNGSAKAKPAGALQGKPRRDRPGLHTAHLTRSACNSHCCQNAYLQYMGFAAFAPGEVIFKQGDSGDHFYIILSGAVDVAVDEGNQVLPPLHHPNSNVLLIAYPAKPFCWCFDCTIGSNICAWGKCSTLLARLYAYAEGEGSGASTGWCSFRRACTHAGEHLVV